jgi:hypothetical protein
MSFVSSLSRALGVLFVLGSVNTVWAQTNAAPAEAPPVEKKMGWTPTAALGANAAVSSVSNVVGQTDGSSQTYGLNLGSQLNHLSERSEWQNKLSYNGAATQTPALSRFVKSNDVLKYESVYLYSLEAYPKVGPYARANAEAPVFMGEDVRSAAVTYSIARRDGTTAAQTGTTLRLTDGFRPLTTKESVGAYYKAYETPTARVDVRAGLGAEQIAAQGQLAITGTAADGSISVSELRNISQVGFETAVTGKGQLDTRTAWELGFETLTPFVTNQESNDDRGAFRLTNIDGTAKLSSNLATWAALTYSYKVQIKPQLVDRTQQTHMMVLNFNYNLL